MEILYICRHCHNTVALHNSRDIKPKAIPTCTKCGNSQYQHLNIQRQIRQNIRDFGLEHYLEKEIDLQKAIIRFPGFTIIKVEEVD